VPCIVATVFSLVLNIILKNSVIYEGVIKTVTLLGVHALVSSFVFFIIVLSSKERAYLFDYVLRKFK